MSIRLAVFDMAGTTIADEHAVASAFCNAFARFGYTITEDEVKPIMGYRKTVAIQMVLERMNADWDNERIEQIHDEFVSEMLDYYEYSPDVKALPGAEDVFLSLKERGIRVVLNTGFPREIADVIMDRMQWKERGLVDDYIASDEVDMGRPAPQMIQELMQRSGIDDPREVIKIGDTEVDVNEGRNAGCSLVVGITTGAFTREQLEPYHPDYIIDHLDGLPELIDNRA